MYRLEIAKDKFKFSASHFALFGPACGERMHGHNYYVSFIFECNATSADLGMAAEFNEIKPVFQTACEQLDEYILIPDKSPYLKITKSIKNTDVEFAQKVYSLPNEDIKLLPVVNISVEELSKYLWDFCLEHLKNYPQIKQFGVEVEETRGQKCTYIKPI